MHVEKQLLEPYMLEPVEHKVSLYVKPEERQPSKISDVTGFPISQMVVSQPSPVTYIGKKTLTN